MKFDFTPYRTAHAVADAVDEESNTMSAKPTFSTAVFVSGAVRFSKNPDGTLQVSHAKDLMDIKPHLTALNMQGEDVSEDDIVAMSHIAVITLLRGAADKFEKELKEKFNVSCEDVPSEDDDTGLPPAGGVKQ